MVILAILSPSRLSLRTNIGGLKESSNARGALTNIIACVIKQSFLKTQAAGSEPYRSGTSRLSKSFRSLLRHATNHAAPPASVAIVRI